MLDTLTIEDFAPHVGADFKTGDEGSAFLLRLVSATSLRHRGAGARPGFSVLFRGASAPLLEQRMHQVVHPTRGALSLFLVPVGPDELGMQQYEAIFN